MGETPKSDRPAVNERRVDGKILGQRVTLPALRQPVHTLRRFGVPLTVARTRWMLGLKRRLVILRDHGRLWPKPGFLWQMSQTAATGTPRVGTSGPVKVRSRRIRGTAPHA